MLEIALNFAGTNVTAIPGGMFRGNFCFEAPQLNRKQGCG